MIRILLVDDHPIVRQGIRMVLTERLYEAVVAEAATAEAAFRKISTGQWDIIIADISLPGMSGLDFVKELHETRPEIPTLVLSMHPAPQFAKRALNAGAAAYISKDSPPDALIAAIERARRTRGEPEEGPAEIRSDWVAPPKPHEALSDREYQLLLMLGAGQTTTEIARELGLSLKTVCTYRERLLDKLGMRTNGELMRYAIENGLLDG